MGHEKDGSCYACYDYPGLQSPGGDRYPRDIGGTSAPSLCILLVLGGLVLSFLPGLPTITLDPALILFLFLPPLIYSSAWTTSWREFRANLRPILLLSVGLVLATTCMVAVVAHIFVGLPRPVAFVLGAVVSQRMQWQPVRPPRVSGFPGV